LVTVVAVTIAGLLTARLIGGQDLRPAEILAPGGVALAYATNIFDWTGHSFANDAFNYTWSLSVEEQFYLLWPTALLWGYRRNRRLFAALAVALLGISLAYALYLGLSKEVKYDPHEYFGSDINALPILAGSLLAIVVHNDWLSRTLRYLAPFGLPAVAVLAAVAYRNDTYRCSLVTVAGTGLTVLILIGVVIRPRSAVGTLMASRPMRWLGERSYSIYLWNILARIAILATLGHTVFGDVVWIAMFVVLSELSFRYVERPLRARFSRRPGVAEPSTPEPVGVGARAS
jgi:peptidoglycan/LPS O-acetylase OafA/YrhL